MKSDEATQSIEYTRTIVPSSMRSPYWKYFGFPSDNANNILTKQKIICTLCNTAIAYNKNTSNLRTHLIAKHCQLLHEIQQQQDSHSAQKRRHSETVAQSQSAVDVIPSYLEKKSKDDGYTLTEATVDACFEVDYKQPTHPLIVEEDEDEDVVEMVAPVLTGEEVSDIDTVDFEDYATNLQPVEAQSEFQSKNVDAEDEDLRQNTDDPYAYINVGSVCPQRDSAENSTAAVNIEDTVVDMLITDLLPASTVDGEGFNHLFTRFGSLNRSVVRLKLSSLYDDMFENVSAYLKNVCLTQTYSLSVEINKNVDQLPVTCVYINYYSVEDNKIMSVLYQNHVLTEEFMVSNQCMDFENIFKDLNLSKCAAAVLNESNCIAETFFRSHGIPTILCLESVLGRCLSKIFDLPNVKREFNKVAKFADDCFKLDRALLVAPPEVYPLCAWSKLNLLEFCIENLSFNNFVDSEVLDKTRDLVNYLCPLKITLETIADEPLSLCSLMRPFTLRLLEKHFSAYFSEEDFLREVKHILSDELTSSILKNSFLNEATFFDARFRRDFLDAENVTAIKAAVFERFKPLVEPFEESPIKEEQYISSSNRKSSLKSFFQRTSETSQKSSVARKKLSIEYEFNKYNCEPTLDLEQCPVTWWQENCYNFKQLKPIADYYLSVPCCLNRLFKCSVSERNELRHKRLMLRNPSAQQIWYLHYNKSYHEALSQQQLRCVYTKSK